MAFGSESCCEKQRLNLSTTADEVVASDIFTFQAKNRNDFINKIFEHFRQKAEASISLRLNCLKDEFNEFLSRYEKFRRDNKLKPLSCDDKDKILTAFISQQKDKLKAKVDSYENGKRFMISLHKHNFDYLTQEGSECDEQDNYDKRRGRGRGQYIKSVIEEYARLPYVEREKIFFSPKITEIQSAIDNNNQLSITTDKDVIYSVYPYEILSDPLSTANYLVGYCKLHDSQDEKKPCSFRISALKSVNRMESKSSHLTEEDRQILSKKISSSGVQFLAVNNEAEIRVKLTADGVNKYRRLIHLRPPRIDNNKEEQNNIYIFKCTVVQAEFYFFKFGKDAEILEPPDLRKKFKKMYEDAANAYANEGECRHE